MPISDPKNWPQRQKNRPDDGPNGGPNDGQNLDAGRPLCGTLALAFGKGPRRRVAPAVWSTKMGDHLGF